MRALGHATSRGWIRWIPCLGAILVLGSVSSASAQLSAGVDASYNNSILSGSWGFGGRAGVELPPMGSVRWKLVGGAVWYVPSCGGGTCDWWEAHGTLQFSRPGDAPVSPYAGIGVSYHTFTLGLAEIDDNDWGVDVLVGTPIGRWGVVLPYAELRYKFMNERPNQFVFTFGIGIGG